MTWPAHMDVKRGSGYRLMNVWSVGREGNSIPQPHGRLLSHHPYSRITPRSAWGRALQSEECRVQGPGWLGGERPSGMQQLLVPRTWYLTVEWRLASGVMG